MAFLKWTRTLWRNLRQRERIEQELDDELNATLELLAEENRRAGLPEEHARRAAAVELRVEPVKERVREVRVGATLDTVAQDLRYSWRHLRRSPGFALAAVMTLALGISANTAMFSMLNTLAFRRLPIEDPDGLIAIAPRDSRGLPRSTPVSAVEVLARDGPLEHLCGYLGAVVLPVLTNGTPAQRSVTFVTGQCFNAFRVRPILGRPITDVDSPIYGPGARVAVISHRLWTTAFDADPLVLGRSFSVNSVEVEIIGVLPRGFGGLEIHQGIDVFTTFDSVIPASANRRQLAEFLLGRLRSGVTFEQAAAQIEARWPAVLEIAIPASVPASERAQLRDSMPRLERIGTGTSWLRQRYVQPVTLVFGLTTVLLLLTCVNLGGLLLARFTARQSELAVKVALGGTKWRIAQQMVLENLWLSVAAAALALPLASAIAARLSFLISPVTASTMSFAPDLRVLTVTSVIAILVGVLVSAMPMWITMRHPAAPHMMWNRTIVSRTSRWGRGFLIAQVALSLVLLVSAALLTRSLYLLRSAPLGVRTSDVVNIMLDRWPNAPPIDRESYNRRLLAQIQDVPGVRSAALSMMFPRATTLPTGSPITFTGEEHRGIETAWDYVSPGFFDTVGIPLIAGRDFTWFDNPQAQRVCIVSESLARALGLDGNVLGRSVTMRTMPVDLECVVIGTAADATQGDPRNTHPRVVYRPALQLQTSSTFARHVLVQTTDPDLLAAAVPQILRHEGQHYAREIITLDDLFARAPFTERMTASVAAGVGVLAILIALIGIYGALAYAVSRRRREIGVRLALGAVPISVAGTVVREALLVTGIGIAVGVPAALFVGRSLRSLMYGISEMDVATFAAVTVFLLVLGAIAALVPARRAAGVDPMIALRAE